jgi:hypothetical protein
MQAGRRINKVILLRDMYDLRKRGELVDEDGLYYISIAVSGIGNNRSTTGFASGELWENT